MLVREYQGERHTVTVADGFVWREETYASLSTMPTFLNRAAFRAADRFPLGLKAAWRRFFTTFQLPLRRTVRADADYFHIN